MLSVEDAPSGSPYRRSPSPPRYLCIVCYRSLSRHPATCRTCDSPMLDITEPAVREEVHAEAERRLQRRKYREEAPIFAFSLIAGTAIVVSIGLWWPLGLFLAYPIQRGCLLIYTRLRPGSAIVTYAIRRQRISKELGVDVQVPLVGPRVAPAALTAEALDESIATSTANDPSTLDLMELLKWLGAKIDD